MENKLDRLKGMTDVVADTGDLSAIKQFKPLDATTNPSLLLQAAALEEWQASLADAIRNSKTADTNLTVQTACEAFAIAVGSSISKIIPGRVSTEVDARLSFDTRATVDSAKRLIDRYAEAGINKDRILIKIASTWEGIAAARQLEKEGINCNLTLLFNFAQAAACADAGVYLISPFVGRILDWHAAQGNTPAQAVDDPGVQSVKRIFNYYKAHEYSTIVMGASFRNAGQIEELAGCDRLTISPALLAELEQDTSELPRKLDPAKVTTEPRIELPHSGFLWAMNEDEMAHEKLADGIRKFTADQIKLETLIADQLSQAA